MSAALQEKANPVSCSAFSARFGLNKAIIPGLFRENSAFVVKLDQIPATLIDNQFTAYLQSLSRLDLGESIATGKPVTRSSSSVCRQRSS